MQREKVTQNIAEPSVVIVGMGAYTPLGHNCEEIKQALLEGVDSITKLTAFDVSRFIGDLASTFNDDFSADISEE